MQNDLKRKKDREYQAKHRGSKRSYVTEIEQLKVLLAWEAGRLSEGWAAKVLNLDRVSLRDLRLNFLEEQETIGETGNTLESYKCVFGCRDCQDCSKCIECGRLWEKENLGGNDN